MTNSDVMDAIAFAFHLDRFSRLSPEERDRAIRAAKTIRSATKDDSEVYGAVATIHELVTNRERDDA